MSKWPPKSDTVTSIELDPYASPESPRPRKLRNENDDLTLKQLGKKPVLKRRFGLVSIIAFSCLVLNTWGGAFQLLGVGLLNGGPAGLFYGWIVVWVGTFATFACLAELSSIAPTSGGQYHWVSILAPASNQKLFSYVTGWLTVLGWQAGVAASSYISGTIIQALIGLVHPSYNPKLWHGTLLLYGVLSVCIFFTTVLGRALPTIEVILLTIYFLGFFAVMVPMLYLGSHASAETVFTTFLNGGGWSSQSLSFFVGLSGFAFALLGADSAVHLSEEVQYAALTVPRSILISLLINGSIGLAMLVAVLFSIQDLDGLIAQAPQYPFVPILLQSTKSTVGTAIIIAILVFNQIGLNIGNVAAASRMLWSFARDRGIPGWRLISKVDRGSTIPTPAIIATTTFSLLVGLISIGSAIAFNDVISLSIDGLYSSYLLCCGLLLWRRCTGTIKLASEAPLGSYGLEGVLDGAHYTFNQPGSEGRLVWGPVHMPGYLGIAVNAFACLYMIVILFFSVWPPATPTTAASMNYSVLMFGAAALLSSFYYVLWARKTYTGPVVEVSSTA